MLELAAADPTYQLVNVYRSRRHLLPDSVVAFSEDSSGNMIELDYGASKCRPPVVFLNHERPGPGGDACGLIRGISGNAA